MKKLISKILVVTLLIGVVAAYQPIASAKNVVKAGEEATTTEVATGETTTPEVTTEVETTEPETTVPETTKAPQKITPGKVKSVKASNVSNTSLTITWKAGANATSYIVYRSSEGKKKMSKYKKMLVTKSTGFIDNDLAQGRLYKYKIVSQRNADGFNTKSKGVVKSVMTKLDNVQSFHAYAYGKSIKLTWKKNAKADKYYIYRAKEKNGGYTKFKKIKTLSKKKKSYISKGLTAGKFYKFKIVVYRKKSGIKSKSRGVTRTAMTRIAAPNKIKTKESDKKIVIKWNKVSNASKYELYKGNKKLVTTRKTTYTVKGLKERHTYNFKIRAVRTVNGKKYKSEFKKFKAATSIGGVKGTWIEVCIKTQTLKMYVHNKLYVKTSVVTGNVGPRHTKKGHHKVMQKQSKARLKGEYNGEKWDVVVNCWLGFTGDGQGIHDSTWRSAYGGSIYKYDGSHGCVNVALGPMKKIFKKAYVGMPVIVY